MDESTFLAAIAESWEDDAPRLVFADWLDERGDVRAEFLRLECQLAHLPAEDERRRELLDRFRQIGRGLGRHWLHSVSRVPGWGIADKFEEIVTPQLERLAQTPPRDRWERRLFERLKALPLGVDFCDYILLEPNGSVLAVLLESDEDWRISDGAEEPAVLGRILRLNFKRRYRALWEELQRWATCLPRCPGCAGKGKQRGRRECEECGGLGWVPDTSL
jgi:uncharacterized protein (TIGR02996 family)